MEQHFGPCCLRRHIVAHLTQMHLMNVRQSDPQRGIQYTGHSHDSNIRSQPRYDPPERRYYDARRRNLQLITPAAEHCRLLVERDWLRHPPMDYRAFEHFIDNPSLPQYAEVTDLVIELYLREDFIDPPPGVPDLDAADRQNLANRLLRNGRRNVIVYLSTVDDRIYTGLTDPWLAAISRMPPEAKRIRAIAKNNHIPGMIASVQGLRHNELFNIGQAMDLLEMQGRCEAGGMLLVNTPIM